MKDRIRILKEFSAKGPEQAREAASRIFSLENSRKAYEGRYQGLIDAAIFSKKQQEENDFKARVMANRSGRRRTGNAWNQIAEAEKKAATRSKEQYFHGFDSSLASLAQTIVQYVAEIKKPDGERLPGFHDSQLDSLKFQVASSAPIYNDMEIARMTGALALDLAEAGANDPFVKLVLNGQTPCRSPLGR